MSGVRSECAGCGLVFGGVKSFDLHRTGSYANKGRRCRTLDEIKAMGLVQNEKGIWGYPASKNFGKFIKEKTNDRQQKSQSL